MWARQEVFGARIAVGFSAGRGLLRDGDGKQGDAAGHRRRRPSYQSEAARRNPAHDSSGHEVNVSPSAA